MSTESDTVSEKHVAHYCEKGQFICFQIAGHERFVLSAPGISPVFLSKCPFCEEGQ